MLQKPQVSVLSWTLIKWDSNIGNWRWKWFKPGIITALPLHFTS